MKRFSMALLWVLAACNSDDKGGETGNVDDTADTSDTSDTDTGDTDTGETDTVIPCETVAIATTPEDGTTDFYYRDTLGVTFSDDASGATIQILDASGVEVPSTVAWGDGNFQAEVTPTEPLDGDAQYQLHIAVCEYTGDVLFTTSAYGSPLAEEAAGLVGNTYVLDLSQADILQPEGLGYLLAAYLTEPILLGVDHADESVIGMVGAQGFKKNDGTYKQVGTEVWIFPDADFTTSPYFAASTPEISIDYADVAIPIENFSLAGTFAADGSKIGGGWASGLGDTRNMGPLLELGDDPGAVCTLISALGLSCETCSDGEPYCVFLEVEFDEAPLATGLTIDTSVGG